MKTLNLKYMIGIFLVLFMVSCKDDTYSPANVEEGLSAKLNLSIQVPAVEDVAMSRAITDNESRINELALFCYSVNSDLSYRVDLTDNLAENATDGNGHRVYTLNSEVSVKTGTFTVYAVANWSSAFAPVALGDMPTENELKEMLVASSNGIAAGDGFLPMSEKVENVTFYDNVEENQLSLDLKRITARIEFTFDDTNAQNNNNGHFTPETYQIFNLPTQSYLIDREGANNELDNQTFMNTDVMNFNGTASFEFLMNENVRPAADGVSSYADRDAYEGSNWSSHNFTHAPENSTYVVVSGKYEDNTQNANVQYLIHLGNFSSTGSNNNFTVNRNERHIYTVHVNGIDNVTTDVTVEDPSQPGAYSDDKGNKELAFVDAAEQQVADAHYVMYPVRIKTNHLLGSSWTVAVDDPDNHSWVTLKKESELSSLQQMGYWTSNELGGQSVSGDDTNNAEQTIYVFMEENAARDASTRDVTLNLYKTDFPDVKKSLTINQLPVNWNGNIGNERIEDGQYPWGFDWNRMVTYRSLGLWGPSIMSGVASLMKRLYDISYINIDYYGIYAKISIDYSQINSLGNLASSTDNGYQNSVDLYRHQGVSTISNIETVLDDWRSLLSNKQVTGDDELDVVQNFAVKMCIMKNKFTADTEEIQGDDGTTVEYPIAVISNEDIKWYLPASGQFPINDDEYPLSGDYWTSTAVSGNEAAYKYTVGGGVSQENRVNALNLRAVRRAD